MLAPAHRATKRGTTMIRRSSPRPWITTAGTVESSDPLPTK